MSFIDSQLTGNFISDFETKKKKMKRGTPTLSVLVRLFEAKDF